MVPANNNLKAWRNTARACVVCLLLCAAAQAGGPAFVAGSAFDPARSGKPILWASGAITYYTDQGDLSVLLPQASANAFVADAFSRWTSVNTVALSATYAGSLAEDVNGSNVLASSSGISFPSDIQPTAAKPIAIVYDFDGAVTDALLGSGASDATLCATNSILGGVDHFLTDGHIGHALLIINGHCAQTPSDLAPLKYRLIRAIGRVLGVGWSQANDNVLTNSPFPSSADFAGFPLMHPLEPFCGGPITSCLPNADQLRMDDRAAVSRLYPVTTQNQFSFPAKQIFAASTVSIHGSVYFPDVQGNAGQPMQGVNVVARLIDPNTGQPSKSAVVTSVSGFLFRGNAGNAVSGYGDPQRLDSFGGADPSLEGFFDLSGLELPAGHPSASFQITLESVDPLYRDDAVVGPYANGQVAISGSHAVMVLANLSAGADVQQDIIMSGAAVTKSVSQQSTPRRPVPIGGEWWGTLSGYGRTEFYRFAARGNRTIGLQVISTNEALHPASNKLEPELGLWVGTDPGMGLPQSSSIPLSGSTAGSFILLAPVTATGTSQIGITDYRGDGRPDFIYHAHLLYADSVMPTHLPDAGGIIQITGMGFRESMTVTVGNAAATVLSVNQNSIYAQAPTLADGKKDVTIQEAASGIFSTMTGALTYGTSSGDLLISRTIPNPTIAIGLTAPNPVRFRAVSSDGATPTAGASIALSISPPNSVLSACGGSACVLTADANGEVSSPVLVNNAGVNVITASLADGQQQSVAIVGTSDQTLALLTPQLRILAGTSITVPLAVKLTSGGVGMAGKLINYTILSGSGALDHSSAITDVSGSVSVNLTLTNFIAAVSINACSGTTCSQFAILPASTSSIVLSAATGGSQTLPVGQALQPIVLRVTDSANPPNPVMAKVTVFGEALALASPSCGPDGLTCQPGIPHALGTFNAVLTSDTNGLVSYTPVIQSGWGPVTVNLMATAGAASQNLTLQVFAPSQ